MHDESRLFVTQGSPWRRCCTVATHGASISFFVLLHCVNLHPQTPPRHRWSDDMKDEPRSQLHAGGSVNENYVPNISSRFGQIGDFWKRYDELADKKDREMSKNLNGNLDVLLIFVSDL